RVRIRQRVPHARLRREMDDSCGAIVGEKAIHSFSIAQVELSECKAFLPLELIEPGVLQPHIVVVVDVVEPDDVVAPRKKAPADMKTDKSGGAGNENSGH